MRYLILALFLFVCQPVLAENICKANLVAIGQGVSSPTSTSTVNYSSGYTAESPLGTIYQNGVRLTGQYDQNDDDNGNDDDAIGAELGYGQGEWGVAVGYRKRNCDDCDGNAAAAFGVTAGDFGFGIRFGEDLYSAALLLNPHGSHRLGLMGELNDSAGDNASVTAYGVGYSYVAPQFTLTLDASSRTFENDTIDDDRILVTPGIMVRADIVQLSVNDKITLNRNASQMDDDEHDLWFGIGVGGESWHIVGYSDYVSELAVVGSLFF